MARLKKRTRPASVPHSSSFPPSSPSLKMTKTSTPSTILPLGWKIYATMLALSTALANANTNANGEHRQSSSNRIGTSLHENDSLRHDEDMDRNADFGNGKVKELPLDAKYTHAHSHGHGHGHAAHYLRSSSNIAAKTSDSESIQSTTSSTTMTSTGIPAPLHERLLANSKIELRTFFAYFLIGIAVLSLFGWAYVGYMRWSYNRKMRYEQQIQHDSRDSATNGTSTNSGRKSKSGKGIGNSSTGGNGKACCKKGDVFPIPLVGESPDVSPHGSPSRQRHMDGDFPSLEKIHQNEGGRFGRGRGKLYNPQTQNNNQNRQGFGYNTTSMIYHGDASSSPSHGTRSLEMTKPSMHPQNNQRVFGKQNVQFHDQKRKTQNGEEDDDSFARELQVAARADQHTWAQFEGSQKKVFAKKKIVPNLKPSRKDVEHISKDQFSNARALATTPIHSNSSPNKQTIMNSNLRSPRNVNARNDRVNDSPAGYLPTKFHSRTRPLQQDNMPKNPMMRKKNQQMDQFHHSDMEVEDLFNSSRNHQFQHQQQHPNSHQNRAMPMHFDSDSNQRGPVYPASTASDPQDMMLPSEDGSSMNDLHSSATSDSYAGKSSSVEEGEHDGYGFHVVGYHRGVKDEMGTYLLNPMPDDDDRSFGNSSGMEMSLGTNTAYSSAQSSDFTQGTAQGRGSKSRGFFVINGDNDMTDEYIPKEEYDAAVMAAFHTLKNSPRNSPRNSPVALNGNRADVAYHRRGINQFPSDEPEELRHFPSDEPQDSSLSNGYSDGFSASEGETTSFDPRSSSVDTSSDPTLSLDIYKELKSVSNFIKKFEQKQKRKVKNIRESSSSVIDLSCDTSTFNSSNTPSLQLTATSKTSGSSANTREEKKKTFLRSAFSRKKKGNQKEEISDMEVKVKQKKKNSDKKRNLNRDRQALPPRHSNSKSYEQEEEEEDDVVMMANHHQQKLSPRRQLPVAGNGNVPGIGISPSGESGASDTKFLHSEIESFFSQNDSALPIMSPSIDRVQRPITRNSEQEMDSKQKFGNFDEEPSFGNEASFESNFTDTILRHETNRLGAAPFDPEQSPYANRVYGNKDSKAPPKSIKTVSPRNNPPKVTPPLASSKKDTERVYSVSPPPLTSRYHNDVSTGNDTSQVPLAHSARTMLETSKKGFASMIDRARISPKREDQPSDSNDGEKSPGVSYRHTQSRRDGNQGVRQNGLPDLETKLQNSAKTLLNIFETKRENGREKERPQDRDNYNNEDRNMSDRISSRLDQIRRNVKERSAQEDSFQAQRGNRSSNRSHISANSNTDSYAARRKSSNVVQVANFESPEKMISPSSIKVRKERGPSRIVLNNSNTTQQSGDFPTENGQVASKDSGSNEVTRLFQVTPKTTGNKASSTAGSTASNAKSLISMFESRRSNTASAIFPPGENWQSGMSRKLFN